MANVEKTSYRLQPSLQPSSVISIMKPVRKRKTATITTRTSSQVTFPIDFFEHNQQLTDVEFGGNDLLLVYNAQQIKHRLNSTGMYVANTKVRTGYSALGSVPGQQGSRTCDVRNTSPVGMQGSQSLTLAVV